MMGYFHRKPDKTHRKHAEMKIPIRRNTTPSFKTPEPQHKTDGIKKTAKPSKYGRSLRKR
jgi:hypothetical protein